MGDVSKFHIGLGFLEGQQVPSCKLKVISETELRLFIGFVNTLVSQHCL